jgi:multidrug efflux pump subunit AcrB
VLVFVPLAFIVGVYGQFFALLSQTLSIAGWCHGHSRP